MSLGVVHHAVKLKKHSVLVVGTTAIVPGSECLMSSMPGIEDREITFKPREDQPDYCSDCYNKVGLSHLH
jgi:hypothetical protein